MTTVKYVTKKEMVDQTGMDALGYAKPKNSLILLRKGMPKKLENEVRGHEAEHIRNGEEGPFLGVGGAILGGSIISGILGSKAAGKQSRASERSAAASTAEQRRQFDLQREDTAPYREAGVNALNTLQGEIGGGRYTPGQFQYGGQIPTNMPESNVLSAYRGATAPPEFSYTGTVPTGAALPEYGDRGRFQFNMEADPGYQFARDEAIKATNRSAAAGGRFGSGNRLAEIADRVTGVASQYANDIYNRQMGASRENYGRGLTEYGLDYQRAGDIYGRQRSAEQEQYGRGLTAYDIAAQREATQYGRGLTESELAAQREQQQYQRDLGRYGIGADIEGQQYQRALTGYGLDYQRQQDIYGQNQNYLNRLSSLAGTGQTAVGQSGAAGSNMANAIANINQANAQQQGQAAQLKYGGMNQAVQGGIGNYLTYQGLQPQVPATNYYSAGRVAPGGTFPPSTINYGG